MSTADRVFLTFQIMIFCLGLLALRRNKLVYKEKLRVLEDVGRLARIDSDHGLDSSWRYEAMDEISYELMFRHFWRPVNSFYKGHRCLRES